MRNRLLIRRNKNGGGFLLCRTRADNFSMAHRRDSNNILSIWKADDFGYVVSSKKGNLWVVFKFEDMMPLIKTFFGIKDDADLFPLIKVPPDEFRNAGDDQLSYQRTECPHCNSTNNIGHGIRKTLKYVQTRRWCNDCHRTFVSAQQPRNSDVESKPQEPIIVLPEINFDANMEEGVLA